MILVLFYHDAPYVEAKQTHIPDVEKLKLRNAYIQMSVCLHLVSLFAWRWLDVEGSQGSF